MEKIKIDKKRNFSIHVHLSADNKKWLEALSRRTETPMGLILDKILNEYRKSNET